MKTLEQGDVMNSWVGENIEVLGGDAPGRSMEASFSALHRTVPYASLLLGHF